MAELSDGHLSTFTIDRLLAELLDDPLRSSAERHAAGCEVCGAHLAEAREARDRFLQHNPPALRAEELTRARSRRWYWFALLVPVAAALVLLVRFGPRPTSLRMSTAESAGIFLADRGPTAGVELRIVPAMHRHVAVYALGDGSAFRLIVELDLDRELTVSVPRTAIDEQFIAVFSSGAVAESRVRAAATSARDAHGLSKMEPFAIDGETFAEVRTLFRRHSGSQRGPAERP